jgi:8-hydroxy-5-deazaflavin:NADPH oxidoreductase
VVQQERVSGSSLTAPFFAEMRAMRIGIVGAGHIGGALVRRLTKLGHEVSVANSRGPATLSALASETGAEAVTVQEAVRDKDVVVVTIPEKSVEVLPKDLFGAARPDTVVIDTGNYYPQRDGRIEEIERGTTESRWVSNRLGRPVVKVFNNIYAQHLLDRGRPAGAAGRIALPVAGDDAKAKATVIHLLDELGFDGVDAGSIDESWRQQPGTPVYGTDHDAKGVRDDLAKATPERRPEFRAG